jgi:hypothetical protein
LSQIVIIEGVTGAGKSSVIAELQTRLTDKYQSIQFRLILEEETLGDLMEQYRDPVWRANPHFASLESVLSGLESGASASDGPSLVLVERFHLTAFALLPRWSLLRRFDERLARLEAVHVLLTYPPSLAEQRAILRPDRTGWAVGMDDWYGSRTAAVRAAIVSQKRRWHGLTLSALPFLHLDTREQMWPRYADTILTFCLGEGG